MVRRWAAWIALLCFAAAFAAGLLARVPPGTRAWRSALAAAVGLAIGAALGRLWQHLVRDEDPGAPIVEEADS